MASCKMLTPTKYAEMIVQERSFEVNAVDPKDYYHLIECGPFDAQEIEECGSFLEAPLLGETCTGLLCCGDRGLKSINSMGYPVMSVTSQTEFVETESKNEWLKKQIARLQQESEDLDRLEVDQCLSIVKLQGNIDELNSNYDIRMWRIGSSRPLWWVYMHYIPLLFNLMQDRVYLTSNLQSKLLKITSKRTCFYCLRQLKSLFWTKDNAGQLYNSWSENWSDCEEGEDNSTVEEIVVDKVLKRLTKAQSMTERRVKKLKINRASTITEDMVTIRQLAKRESLKVLCARNNII